VAEELTLRLENLANTAERILDALHSAASSRGAENWRPHLPQMHSAVVTFLEFCQDQIDRLSESGFDETDSDAIHEAVSGEANRLFDWLSRMTTAV